MAKFDISLLREKFGIELNPVTMARVEKDAESLDDSENHIDSALHTIFKSNSKPFFFNRELDKLIIDKISQSGDDIRILTMGNDSGQTAYGIRIFCEANKSLLEGKTITIYESNISNSLIKEAINGTYNYKLMMDAELSELEYFSGNTEEYRLNDNVKDVQFINASYCNIPLKKKMIDIAVIGYYTAVLTNEMMRKMIDEVYSVLKEDGILLSGRTIDMQILASKFSKESSKKGIFYKKISHHVQKGDVDYDTALRYFQAKAYDHSTAVLNALIGQGGDINPDIFKLLLMIHTRKDEMEKIREMEERLKEQNMMDADIHFIIGSYYFNKSDYSIASEYFKKAVEMQPSFVHALYYLAQIEHGKGREMSYRELIASIRGLFDSNIFYNPAFLSQFTPLDMIKVAVSSDF